MKLTLNIKRLKEKREEKGWNKLGRITENGSQSVYVRYENGERTPTYSVIKNIVQPLGTSAEYLTNQTDNPAPVEYVVTAQDERLTFIIESYSSFNNNQKERIYSYVKKNSCTGIFCIPIPMQLGANSAVRLFSK